MFCPFTPLTIHKIKILKKWKNMPGDITIYTSGPKIMIICCTVPEIQHVTDKILGYFLPFKPLSTQKSKNFYKWNKRLEISSFYTYVPKIMITWWCPWDMMCNRWMGRLTGQPTDQLTEKVTYRGGWGNMGKRLLILQ